MSDERSDDEIAAEQEWIRRAADPDDPYGEPPKDPK